MKRFVILTASVFAMSLMSAQSVRADDAAMIKNAEMAAPAAVAKDAQIIAVGADGMIKELRKGSNAFWCMPDDTTTPGNDPMCGDANTMEWVKAWMSKTEPPKGKMGFGYMLAGGSTASNTDPFATAPPAGSDWLKDGPHVMIFNVPDTLSAYPTSATPDASQPYVMFSGTSYAHLMVPVQ